MIYLWSWVQTLGVQLRQNERGATMVEYGLMVALIAAVLILVVTQLGSNLNDKFGEVSTGVQNAPAG